jgi:hypothetical protein
MSGSQRRKKLTLQSWKAAMTWPVNQSEQGNSHCSWKHYFDGQLLRRHHVSLCSCDWLRFYALLQWGTAWTRDGLEAWQYRANPRVWSACPEKDHECTTYNIPFDDHTSNKKSNLQFAIDTLTCWIPYAKTPPNAPAVVENPHQYAMRVPYSALV